MKNLLLATLVGLCAATAALPAHASGPGYTGTCRIATIHDTAGVLPGENVWTGPVDIAVVATIPGDTMVSASCWLKINSEPQIKVLDATVAGPVGAGAGRLTYTAGLEDIVYLCTHVKVGSLPESDSCNFGPDPTPICPSPVCGQGGLLDQVVAVADGAARVLDPAVCGALVTAAPAVDALPTASVLYVDPENGDTYVGGTTRGDLFWDCPPYVEDR